MDGIPASLWRTALSGTAASFSLLLVAEGLWSATYAAARRRRMSFVLICGLLLHNGLQLGFGGRSPVVSRWWGWFLLGLLPALGIAMLLLKEESEEGGREGEGEGELVAADSGVRMGLGIGMSVLDGARGMQYVAVGQELDSEEEREDRGEEWEIESCEGGDRENERAAWMSAQLGWMLTWLDRSGASVAGRKVQAWVWERVEQQLGGFLGPRYEMLGMRMGGMQWGGVRPAWGGESKNGWLEGAQLRYANEEAVGAKHFVLYDEDEEGEDEEEGRKGKDGEGGSVMAVSQRSEVLDMAGYRGRAVTTSSVTVVVDAQGDVDHLRSSSSDNQAILCDNRNCANTEGENPHGLKAQQQQKQQKQQQDEEQKQEQEQASHPFAPPDNASSPNEASRQEALTAWVAQGQGGQQEMDFTWAARCMSGFMGEEIGGRDEGREAAGVMVGDVGGEQSGEAVRVDSRGEAWKGVRVWGAGGQFMMVEEDGEGEGSGASDVVTTGGGSSRGWRSGSRGEASSGARSECGEGVKEVKPSGEWVALSSDELARLAAARLAQLAAERERGKEGGEGRERGGERGRKEQRLHKRKSPAKADTAMSGIIIGADKTREENSPCRGMRKAGREAERMRGEGGGGAGVGRGDVGTGGGSCSNSPFKQEDGVAERMTRREVSSCPSTPTEVEKTKVKEGGRVKRRGVRGEGREGGRGRDDGARREEVGCTSTSHVRSAASPMGRAQGSDDVAVTSSSAKSVTEWQAAVVRRLPGWLSSPLSSSGVGRMGRWDIAGREYSAVAMTDEPVGTNENGQAEDDTRDYNEGRDAPMERSRSLGSLRRAAGSATCTGHPHEGCAGYHDGCGRGDCCCCSSGLTDGCAGGLKCSSPTGSRCRRSCSAAAAAALELSDLEYSQSRQWEAYSSAMSTNCGATDAPLASGSSSAGNSSRKSQAEQVASEGAFGGRGRGAPFYRSNTEGGWAVGILQADWWAEQKEEDELPFRQKRIPWTREGCMRTIQAAAGHGCLLFLSHLLVSSPFTIPRYLSAPTLPPWSLVPFLSLCLGTVLAALAFRHGLPRRTHTVIAIVAMAAGTLWLLLAGPFAALPSFDSLAAEASREAALLPDASGEPAVSSLAASVTSAAPGPASSSVSSLSLDPPLPSFPSNLFLLFLLGTPLLPLSLPSLFLMNANNMVGVYPGLGCVLAFLLYLLLIVWSVALLAYEKLGPLAILRGSLPLLLAVTVGGAAWGSWKLPDVAAEERGGFVMPSRTRTGRAKGKSGVPSLLVRHLHSRPFLCTMSRYDVTCYFMGF